MGDILAARAEEAAFNGKDVALSSVTELDSCAPTLKERPSFSSASKSESTVNLVDEEASTRFQSISPTLTNYPIQTPNQSSTSNL